MIFKTLVAVSILLNGILTHMEWKHIENLEKWALHLSLKQTNDERLRRWKERTSRWKQ